MKKTIFYLAFGLVVLLSCNQNKDVKGQVDQIKLRAKTDTVIGFNNINIGDTLDAQKSIKDTISAWYEGKTKIITETRTEPVYYYIIPDDNLLDNGKRLIVSEIDVTASVINDPLALKEIIKLYVSKYGPVSYYTNIRMSTVIPLSSDSLQQKYIDEVVNGGDVYTNSYERQLVWEWKNCSIKMYIEGQGHESFRIVYSKEGYDKRERREAERSSEAKENRI